MIYTPARGWWQAKAERERVQAEVVRCGYDPARVGEPTIVHRKGRKVFAFPLDLPRGQAAHVKVSLPD